MLSRGDVVCRYWVCDVGGGAFNALLWKFDRGAGHHDWGLEKTTLTSGFSLATARTSPVVLKLLMVGL